MTKIITSIIKPCIFIGILSCLIPIISCKDDYDTYIEDISISPGDFSGSKIETFNDYSIPTIKMGAFVISGYFITSKLPENDFRSQYFHLNPALEYIKVMVKEDEVSEAKDVSSAFRSIPKGLFGRIPVNIGSNDLYHLEPLKTLRYERGFDIALRDSMPEGKNIFYVVGVFDDDSEIISNEISVILTK